MKEKTRINEGVKKMRFESIYEDYQNGRLTCIEAGEILGMSERTFRRKKAKFEEEGIEGIMDRRVGKVSAKRAEDVEVERITKLYAQRFKGFNVKHFYSYAKAHHGLTYGYTWTKNTLEKRGLITRSKRGGDHRLRRERKPMAGMMLHQDASKHTWVLGIDEQWDLVVTMDDATSLITSAFFVQEEGTQSSLQGLRETIETYGLFCSLYTDRGSHYWYTPEAGGKVSKSELTQVGRALKELGVRHIAAYSPQARGRSERMFGTLQGRLPQELALHNIQTIEAANAYLRKTYIPRHNKEFSIPAKEETRAFTPWAGNGLKDLKEILCIKEERVVQNDNTVRYKGLILQIPKTPWRHHYVKTEVQVHDYGQEGIGLFYGHQRIGTYTSAGKLQEASADKTKVDTQGQQECSTQVKRKKQA